MADHAYEAVLLLSFGGPEGPDDVMPFLENVTRGRGVPPERLEEVAQQYQRFGGVSPINEQNRALLAALRAELDRRGLGDLPLYWGNRNWAPYVEDTVASVADDGHERVLALATSAYSSYSACRQYLEDIERARAHVGDRAPIIDKIPPYWSNPGFLDAVVDRVREAVAELPDGRLVFTAHSIPVAMAETCDYEEQLRRIAGQVAERIEPGRSWDLVFQSRSGPPQVPWLEPDIVDHLGTLAGAGTTEVVVVPIGFISDHMEVKFDLDTQAAEAAERLGMRMVRAGTVGTHPAFVGGLVDLIETHLSEGVTPCAPGCCPAPVRPGRAPR